MTKLKAFTLAGVAASALFATPASAQTTIYDNAVNYSGLFTSFIGNGEIGDQITFGGTDRVLTEFRLEYFLTPGASASAQVFIRANDGAETSAGSGIFAPGTVLYDSGVFTISGGATGINNIAATGLSLQVPNDVTWSVAFSGVDAGEEVGLLYYNPPTIGESFDDFWQNVGGTWTLMDTPGEIDNFGAIFTAVPEPSTWALLLGGMGMLGFMGFRRKS